MFRMLEEQIGGFLARKHSPSVFPFCLLRTRFSACSVQIRCGECVDYGKVPGEVLAVVVRVEGHTIGSHLAVWRKSAWLYDDWKTGSPESTLKNVVDSRVPRVLGVA